MKTVNPGTSNTTRNALIKDKIWKQIAEYRRCKDLVEIFDGDENNLTNFEYYYEKMREAQYNAYYIIDTFKCYRFLELIDM